MTAVLLAVVAALLIALAAVGLSRVRQRSRHRSQVVNISASRILFPFLAHALSSRALEAALRLARAENATLVPVFLARVPFQLPLDTPLPRQCALAIPMHEAIEQRAAVFGVPVDARIERGRTPRHALRQTITHERFDRIVIAAATADVPASPLTTRHGCSSTRRVKLSSCAPAMMTRSRFPARTDRRCASASAHGNSARRPSRTESGEREAGQIPAQWAAAGVPTSWPLADNLTSMFPRVAFE
jgi:nucleotide-binding universal stress UspA family protein